MSDRRHELDYAPREAHEVHRAWIRRTIRIIFVLAVTTALIAIAIRLVRQALYLRVQRACMTHVLPPHTVVFQTMPTRSANFAPVRTLVPIDSDTTVFSHERWTPAGASRYVLVNYWWNSEEVVISGAQYLPATLMLKSRVSLLFPPKNSGLTLPARARIFAGQPDPNDPTHLTIDYELDGQRHVIDGWLTSDGEVKLETRPIPADTPGTRTPSSMPA